MYFTKFEKTVILWRRHEPLTQTCWRKCSLCVATRVATIASHNLCFMFGRQISFHTCNATPASDCIFIGLFGLVWGNQMRHKRKNGSPFCKLIKVHQNDLNRFWYIFVYFQSNKANLFGINGYLVSLIRTCK
jgi:hypothetical protein